uniref:Uncharacterized protein n=1 Tax=Physcomitrium patens TaxID=3218 RepID=A0A2K1K3F0_PHYPA|nr:hypothetical protein PHYPA_012772 [Physcomitrium patens]
MVYYPYVTSVGMAIVSISYNSVKKVVVEK